CHAGAGFARALEGRRHDRVAREDHDGAEPCRSSTTPVRPISQRSVTRRMCFRHFRSGTARAHGWGHLVASHRASRRRPAPVLMLAALFFVACDGPPEMATTGNGELHEGEFAYACTTPADAECADG